MVLSADLKQQLYEQKSWIKALNYRGIEQDGIVRKSMYSNPRQRSKRQIRKLKADLADLILAAKYLDVKEEHSELFDKKSLVDLILAFLDVSRKRERMTVLEDQLGRMNDECYHEMEKEPDSAKKVKISDRYTLRQAEIRSDEAFQNKPDARRVEAASAIAAVCLDFCYEQIKVVEPDPNIHAELFQKSFDLTKRLMESTIGKVSSSPNQSPPLYPAKGTKNKSRRNRRSRVGS